MSDTASGDWHVGADALARWQAGAAAPAQAASVEAHVERCAGCRAAVAGLADPARLDRNWAAVLDRIDERRPSVAERLLARAGVREDRARLVVATPALRRPALVAVLAVLATAVAVDRGGGEGAFFGFLVLAPLLPLVGVAIAFGGRSDPVRELARATPTPAFQLLLARALAVVATTTVLTVAASAVLDRAGWRTGAWLLPALGLSAAALALSTWMPAEWAAAGLGTAWVAAAVVSWRFDDAADGAARFLGFRPSGQVAAAIVLAVAAVVVVGRRDSLDVGRLA